MLTNFAKLEFFLSIDKKGKGWVISDPAKEGYVQNCQDIMENEQVDNNIPDVKGQWMMEQFDNALAIIWRDIKYRQLDVPVVKMSRSSSNGMFKSSS